MERNPFRGIYPMLYAVFGADGALDRAAMERQVEACVRGGAHGVAVLGLATEVGKLAPGERADLLAWTAEALADRLPLAVTVAEATVAAQVAAARAAEECGAAWVILQPPSPDIAEADLLRFFGSVADRVSLPIGIQNAPQYIGTGLGPDSLLALHRNHGNVRLLKGEGPVLTIRRIVEESGGGLAVFNGRAGLELTDNLRAGCAGMIPGVECLDVQARIFDLMAGGSGADEAEAERLYRQILPLIVFVMQSIETLLCYGKRVAARRLGLDAVHDRPPAEAPTDFGLACVERHAARLGPLP
jgi:4-hydroxy-tetrahydrodipicolinate synthase